MRVEETARRRRAAIATRLASALFAAVASGAACSEHPRPPPPSRPLEVAFSRCGSVRLSDDDRVVCEAPEQGTIRLFTEAPPGATLSVTFDSRPVPAAFAPLRGGQALDIAVPSGARELVITAEKGGAVASFRLPLTPSGERAPALAEAEVLRQNGKLDEAEALLTPLLGDPRAAVRALAVGKLARIERRRGEAERAIALFYEALSRDREAGLISDVVFDGLVLSLTLREPGRHFAEARAVLDAIEPAASVFPQGRAMALHYRALLASAVGDLRAALRLFDASDELSERLSLDEHRVDVLEQKADVLSTLGRHDEARDLLQRAEGMLFARGAKPCAEAQWQNNMGWSSLLAEEARGAAAGGPDPIAPLLRSLALHQSSCPDPVEGSRVLVNLAHAELARGGLAEARRYLDASQRTHPDPGGRIKAWWLTLEARLALATGKPAEALPPYEQLQRLADDEGLPDARIEAVAGGAQALDALGRVDAARKAFADADALLERWSLLAPLGAGRDGFVASYEAIARRRVDFLLRQAERSADPAPWLAEAATAARRARVGALASLRSIDRIGSLSGHERDRWEQGIEEYRRQREALSMRAAEERYLPADERSAAAAARVAEQGRIDADFERALSAIADLPGDHAGLTPIAPGELLLLYYPLEQGWAAFAITATTTTGRRIAAPSVDAPGERLAEQLFKPFQRLIEGADRIRFAPYGALQRVDLHALPWDGAPLVARRPVVYQLDLRRTERPEPAPDQGREAVIVADPSADLAAARGEASAVAAVLGWRGWRVTMLRGQDATIGAVRSALEQPATKLLHYAGHGTFTGWDGWESSLVLADGTLRVPDVLALPRVPPTIVLSGCDTAKTNDRVPVEGLGIAQAFVLAGATAVAASVRRVDDHLAERLMTRLYEAPGATSATDLAAALRDTQLAESQRAAAGDWASFRVLMP